MSGIGLAIIILLWRSFPEVNEKLTAISFARKTGTERLHTGGAITKISVMDFWQWSASDLLSNAMRGRFAEFIVACALELEGGVRTEWDAFDLRTAEGTRIEVKSASYIQSWHQTKHSSINFGIRTTLGWDAATNSSATTKSRQAQVYVFCLLHHQDKATVDPLDLAQWKFYVLPTRVLDECLPAQKSISLTSLLRLNPEVCEFSALRRAIKSAAKPAAASPSSPSPQSASNHVPSPHPDHFQSVEGPAQSSASPELELQTQDLRQPPRDT
jgi:hypothetical protein